MKTGFRLMTWNTIFKYCLHCALRYESDVHRAKLRVFLIIFEKFWQFYSTKYLQYNTHKYLTFSVDYMQVINFCQITIRFAIFVIEFSVENYFSWIPIILITLSIKICSMNDAVEMTANQFQQSIPVKLTDNF